MPSPPHLGDRPATRADSPFRRAPYLTRVTTDEARVRWVGAPGRKLRALARTDAGLSVRGQRGVFTELEPGTAHRWLVSADGVPSAGGSFVTAPSDAASPFEFAAIGGADGPTVVDPHRARLLAALPARLLVGVGTLGGMTPGCDLNTVLFDPLGDALRRMPFYGALADPREGPGGPWPEMVAALEWPGVGARYAARYGPVQLLMLGGAPRPDDRAWVRRECARRGAEIRLVVLHRTAPDDRALLAACADLPVSAVLMPGAVPHARGVHEGLALFGLGASAAVVGSRDAPAAGLGAHVSTPGILRVGCSSAELTFTFVDATGAQRDQHTVPVRR